MKPSYLDLHKTGQLTRRVELALRSLQSCRQCPRQCEVNRLEDQVGFCGVGRFSVIASYNPHFGEESPLVGQNGSGTIFFSGCNLGCRFCQNHDISHHPETGLAASPEELAGVMLALQEQGCHNINFVTPSHVVTQILEALPTAIEHGLNIPLVYNTSSYDSPDSLRLLDGIIDIYMPDIKIWDESLAAQYLQARDYPEKARNAVQEMFRQVGDLTLDDEGRAIRGLLVRHLIMPKGVADSINWLKFLAELSTNTYLNIMDQYRPCHEAHDIPPLGRMITPEEYDKVVAAVQELGFQRLDKRDMGVFMRLLGRD